MQVDVINIKGKKINTIELPEEIFEAPINKDLMHQAYVRQMANARLGTHSTKSRGEVRGGGRKPWRQKGTGRARHGSIRSPIWVGGGKTHTPRPRKYTKAMPKKMRQAALRSALSVKASETELIVLDKFEMKEAKTKIVAEIMEKLVGKDSALILTASKVDEYEMVIRSAKNLPRVKTVNASYLSVRDLFTFNKIIIPLDSLEIIKNNLG